MDRRAFLGFSGAFIACAPAIVRVSSIMKINPDLVPYRAPIKFAHRLTPKFDKDHFVRVWVHGVDWHDREIVALLPKGSWNAGMGELVDAYAPDFRVDRLEEVMDFQAADPYNTRLHA